MLSPIKLISTDFDGTLHSGFEIPPIPKEAEAAIQKLQQQGAVWVINTGRDLDSLIQGLAEANLSIRPDYVVVVEREIYQLEGSDFQSLVEWNQSCTAAHEELFATLRKDLPKVVDWVRGNYGAKVYEDPYSPFCLIADNLPDADEIHEYLTVYSKGVPDLTIVRNDIYSRFSHRAYNKGTSLSEIGRRLKIGPDATLAAGDHFNDLPMLSSEFARWLVAPSNAIPVVKHHVARQGGYVSEKSHGYAVAEGVERAGLEGFLSNR
ncbi:MAG: cof [Verrucomicrobiales bacterium]|nr:cof [Verrucomicrobiales bacterium]